MSPARRAALETIRNSKPATCSKSSPIDFESGKIWKSSCSFDVSLSTRSRTNRQCCNSSTLESAWCLVKCFCEELLRFPFKKKVIELQIFEMGDIWRDFLAWIDHNDVQPRRTRLPDNLPTVGGDAHYNQARRRKFDLVALIEHAAPPDPLIDNTGFG